MRRARLGFGWLILAAAACEREAPPPPPVEAPAPAPAAAPVPPRPVVPPGEPFQTTDFRAGNGAESKAAVKGTVDAHPSQAGEPDGVHLRIRLAGLRPGTHAWHIHNGPCSEVGRVIVALSPADTMPGIAQPVVADSSGNAEQTAFVPLSQLSRQRMELRAYSLRIHVPDGDHTSPSEACARL